MPNLIGQSLGRYHILEQLGEGGMATVYKAYDTRLETDVAVKVIRTENLTMATMERALKRFEREAKALARLTHPNIVKVTDYGEHEGKPYLVMEYLPGGTLKERLGQPMPWQEAVRMLIPIAEALDFAHSQNMIHRDVKPSNILLTQRGQPMLTDFGIAKILDLEETQDLTGTGMGIGTPEYMAPEQWTGKTSTLSDQYALGVVLFEMVTGRKPYTADTPAAILLKQATDPLPRPSTFARDLPEKAEKLLIKVLARNPEDRYANMGEFAMALESALGGTSAPAKPQSARSRERMLDTQTTSNQMERSTIEESPAPRMPATQKTTSSNTSNLLRYWPFGLIAVLVVALIFALAGNNNRGANSFPTKAPVMATEALIATEVPVMATELPIATEAPVIATEPPIATEAPVVLDEINDAQGVAMLLIPAGEFTMGSDSGDDNEKPIHQVYLNAYYMDKYEVTNGSYRECVSEGGCYPPSEINSKTHLNYYGKSQFSNYPIVYIDWYSANRYCEWREARLPTEAEWEKAARGIDGRTYPWGEGLTCGNANYDGCVGDTVAVGSYESGKSPYGIYDMAGNVAEWVADWFSDTFYQHTPFENPLGPIDGSDRVVRGGSWTHLAYLAATWSRAELEPGFQPYRNNWVDFLAGIGFRCARSAQ